MPRLLGSHLGLLGFFPDKSSQSFSPCNTEKILQGAGEPDSRVFFKIKNRSTYWPTEKISNSRPTFFSLVQPQTRNQNPETSLQFYRLKN